MKTEDPPAAAGPLERALDAALAKALRSPTLPEDFRIRLKAALARAGAPESRESARARLEREGREGLAELESGYLRLRRRTLGTLVGGAFAAGAGVALLLPWLEAALGLDALRILAALGGVFGLAVGVVAWRERSALAHLLERL